MKPTFKQLLRAVISISIVGVWLALAVIITLEAASNPEFLDDIEGMLALLAIPGVVAVTVINRLFKDDGE